MDRSLKPKDVERLPDDPKAAAAFKSTGLPLLNYTFKEACQAATNVLRWPKGLLVNCLSLAIYSILKTARWAMMPCSWTEVGVGYMKRKQRLFWMISICDWKATSSIKPLTNSPSFKMLSGKIVLSKHWVPNSRDGFRTTSGVFKGRRARHLPRAPPFWGSPLQVIRA